MRRQQPHHHACDDCGVKTECPGSYEENWDGWPEVVCTERDQRGAEIVCDDCHAKREAQGERDEQEAQEAGQ